MRFRRAALMLAVMLIGTNAALATMDSWVIVPFDRPSPVRVESAAAEPRGLLASIFDFFPAAAGLYNGLHAPDGDLFPEHSGYFQISVTSQGNYSGYFVIGGNRNQMNGWFNSEGLAGVQIYKRDWAACHCYQELVLFWTIELDLVPNSDEITGVLFNERHNWRSEMYGLRAGYGSSYDPPTAPQAGRYTLRLPGSVDPVVAPPGDGYGLVTVNSRGLVKMNGALADGAKFDDSAYLSYDGYYPLYVSMNDGRGMLQGWLQFVDGEVSGDLAWFKPSNFDRKHYPNGFDGVIRARGGTYVVPAGSSSPFTWTQGQLQVTEGNVGGVFASDVTFRSPNSVTIGGGDLAGLKLKINAKTGGMNGSFLHPTSGRKTSYAGALFQFENAGGGYFLGIDLGGTVALVESGIVR